jgi:anti-anti-sigma factor
LEEQKSFNYVLSHKNDMLVVSFQGDMTTVVLPGLEACRTEILSKKEIRCVVLYFGEVGLISSDAIPVLAQIQRDVRARPADLRLVGLKESIRERLVKMGVVRGMEISEDLRSALMSFARTA